MAKLNNGTPSEKLINILGVETTIIGSIVTKGDIRLDGKLEGDLRAEGKIIIGVTGFVKGTIYCRNLEVLGKIQGKIEVLDLTKLNSTAHLAADIKTKKLGVEPGAVFTGHCQMAETVKHEPRPVIKEEEASAQ